MRSVGMCTEGISMVHKPPLVLIFNYISKRRDKCGEKQRADEMVVVVVVMI